MEIINVLNNLCIVIDVAIFIYAFKNFQEISKVLSSGNQLLDSYKSYTDSSNLIASSIATSAADELEELLLKITKVRNTWIMAMIIALLALAVGLVGNLETH